MKFPISPRRLERAGPDAPQAVADVRQRDVLLPVGVVHQDGVTVAECAAAGVLAGEAHVDALVHQRADGERLGQRPVDLPARDQLVTLRELALEFRVDGEALRDRPHHGGEGPQHFGSHARLGRGCFAVG